MILIKYLCQILQISASYADSGKDLCINEVEALLENGIVLTKLKPYVKHILKSKTKFIFHRRVEFKKIFATEIKYSTNYFSIYLKSQDEAAKGMHLDIYRLIIVPQLILYRALSRREVCHCLTKKDS